MGFYKRGHHRYFFRSERVGKTVKKLYFGRGPVADLAARADALKQYELKVTRQCWSQDKVSIEAACQAFEELDSGCDMLRDATLLVAGFHRPSLHRWRPWFHGRRILKQDCGTTRRGSTQGACCGSETG